MAISLSKGGNLSLTKTAPALKVLLAGLGWEARITDGAAFDLDMSMFMVTAEGKVRSDADFIFYNQPKDAADSVTHLGDNKTGSGAGDDEQAEIILDSVPADVARIVFAVTIHEFAERKQNFGMVSNAFMRVSDKDTNTEIGRFDLSEDFSTETAVIFGEVYRNGAEWKFKAVGQGFAGGLDALARSYGVNLS